MQQIQGDGIYIQLSFVWLHRESKHECAHARVRTHTHKRGRAQIIPSLLLSGVADYKRVRQMPWTHHGFRGSTHIHMWRNSNPFYPQEAFTSSLLCSHGCAKARFLVIFFFFSFPRTAGAAEAVAIWWCCKEPSGAHASLWLVGLFGKETARPQLPWSQNLAIAKKNFSF